MKIAYMSDIHLEFHRDGGVAFTDEIIANTPEVDLVVLAGDIGVLKTDSGQIQVLLEGLSKKAKKVFYVPGNHEFYQGEYRAGKGTLQDLEYNTPENVVVGSGCFTDFFLDGYYICGGTLWFPDLYPPQHEKEMLNDFNYIKHLEPEIYRENAYCVAQIEKGCMQFPGKSIVVTHHAPSYQSVDPKFAGSPINKFFANNLDVMIEDVKPLVIVSGHLHDAVDYELFDTRITSNPAGYRGELDINWKPKVIEV
jgi:Icc-related predicted phosphoesterase